MLGVGYCVRVLRELVLLIHVHHPAVVKLLDIFAPPKVRVTLPMMESRERILPVIPGIVLSQDRAEYHHVGIVMENVSGLDLRELIKRSETVLSKEKARSPMKLGRIGII